MKNQETSFRDYYYHLSSLLCDKRVKTVHVLGGWNSDPLWWFECDIEDNKPYQNQWISATCSWSYENVGPCKRRDSIWWYSLRLASTNRIKGSHLSRGTITLYLPVDLWGFIHVLIVDLTSFNPKKKFVDLTWLDLGHEHSYFYSTPTAKHYHFSPNFQVQQRKKNTQQWPNSAYYYYLYFSPSSPLLSLVLNIKNKPFSTLKPPSSMLLL